MKFMDHARLLLLAGLWSSSFLFMRITAPVLGGTLTAALRVLIGAASLAVLLPLLGVRLSFGKHLRATLLLGIVNSGIPVLMYALAARVLPAGYSAILNATTPLMGTIIGAAFFAERVDASKIFGVVVGLVGVAVLMTEGPIVVTPSVALGIAACLVATACYGVSGLLTRRWITERGGLDPKLVAFGSQMGANLLLLPFFSASLVNSPALLMTTLNSPHVLLALLALGVGCTAWGYILFFRLVDNVGPIRVLTVTFLIPPFGVLWGVFFLHENLTWSYLPAGVLILSALFLILRPTRKSATIANSAPRPPAP